MKLICLLKFFSLSLSLSLSRALFLLPFYLIWAVNLLHLKSSVSGKYSPNKSLAIAYCQNAMQCAVMLGCSTYKMLLSRIENDEYLKERKQYVEYLRSTSGLFHCLMLSIASLTQSKTPYACRLYYFLFCVGLWNMQQNNNIEKKVESDEKLMMALSSVVFISISVCVHFSSVRNQPETLSSIFQPETATNFHVRRAHNVKRKGVRI